MRSTVAILSLLIIQPVYAADWHQWRGPNHNGSTSESSGWNGKTWPISEAWRVDVGSGGSSPIIAEGKVFTLGHVGDSDVVMCHYAATGKLLWKQSYKCPPFGRHAIGDQSQYHGPSSTPTFDPDSSMLYTLSSDGDLQCWNTKTKGKRVWAINLYQRYGVGQRPQVTKRRNSHRDYGYSTAPLVHDDWLLVEVGDGEGNVMAFNKKTGRREWISQSKDPAGHAGGMTPIKVDGIPCVAVFTAYNVLMIRLDKGHEGKTFAEYPWRTDFINSIASLTAHGGDLIVTSKYNQMRTVKLRLTKKGAAVEWESKIAASGVCSPVVLNNYIYFANRGFWALALNSGELKMDGDNFGDAGSCIVTGDGRIIVWASDGDLVLVQSADDSKAKYKVLGEKRKLLKSTAWPHVALADGRIYCKDRSGKMICFEIKK